MPSSTTIVHVPLDERLKEQATETLAAMGLSLTDAVRVFLTRVVADQELPFALDEVPNKTTQAAMVEAREIIKDHRDRFASVEDLIDDLEKKRED